MQNTSGSTTNSLTTNPNVDATTTTQDDINNGFIQYVNDGTGTDNTSDGFDFSVQDDNGTAATGTFSITITEGSASIDTNNEQRDGHLRGSDFFNAEADEKMTWTSTGLKIDGDSIVADGELTLLGVTRSVPLAVEFNGIGPDAFGGTRAGFSATAEINRSDFGMTYNMAIETGGVVIGDKVTIHLEVEAVLDAPAA